MNVIICVVMIVVVWVKLIVVIIRVCDRDVIEVRVYVDGYELFLIGCVFGVGLWIV